MVRPFSLQILPAPPPPPHARRPRRGGNPAIVQAKGGAFSELGIPPNALPRKSDPNWRAIGVLELRGQKLELRLLEIAEKEEVDEFIIGLPTSFDGRENPQSNKVRSISGRLAARAAERGWRVYLLDEHGTSAEALDFMIDVGLSQSARRLRVDAYAAMMVLERYFGTSGYAAQLVLPKNAALQENLRRSSCKNNDLYSD